MLLPGKKLQKKAGWNMKRFPELLIIYGILALALGITILAIMVMVGGLS